MAALSYEEALEKVRTIVQELEAGELPLEDSIKAYTEGLKLLKVCYDKLNKVEKKLEELSGSLDAIVVDKTALE